MGSSTVNPQIVHVEQELMMHYVVRTPVVVFLSDGECRFEDEVVYDLCRSAVRAGYATSVILHHFRTLRPPRSALSFHAVSFGSEAQAGSLHRMVQIATEIHDAAPRDPLMPLGIPCSYSEALDTVRSSDQLVNKHSQRLQGSTCQYVFGDRRFAAQSQSHPQAYIGHHHGC